MNQDNQNQQNQQNQQNVAPMNTSEDAEKAENQSDIAEKAKGTPKKMTPEEALRTVSRGQLRLATPIRASNKDIEVLHFDFTKLTGWEMAQALDRDTSGKANAYRMTQVQAFEVFAVAAQKMTPDIDAEDIRYRMGVEDAIKAMQLAVSFFNLSSQTANSRITN